MLLHMSQLFMMVLIVFFYRRKSAFFFVYKCCNNWREWQPAESFSFLCGFFPLSFHFPSSFFFSAFSWAGMRRFDWKSSGCLCCLVTGDFRINNNVFSLFGLIPHPFIFELKWRKWLRLFLSAPLGHCCAVPWLPLDLSSTEQSTRERSYSRYHSWWGWALSQSASPKITGRKMGSWETNPFSVVRFRQDACQTLCC